ncbi:c-type cytochrome [Paludibaculum fermentans]|uniref:C-type cytochrome n=1 Tax=Paludibaculum fermentans TaxID=1473598 RepID=A0A7S7NKV9_PALFE|nr:cytochrome c [Paludibaculum fermentans]QOY85511.1 c-type cytochrome [Paludibaculum fermentans]
MKKVLLYVVIALVVIVGGGYAALVLKKPAMNPPSALKVEATAERLQRGKYVFEYVADCGGCHSERNWDKFAAPVYDGRAGVGFVFPPELGFPGKVVAPNLTPDAETGLGSWSDGEKLRAIREGVSKDGRALFAFMPYTHFRKMSDEDANSVVAYMNSLPPVKNRLPRTELNFPVNLMIKFAPQPVTTQVPVPDHSNRLKYGEYLVEMGGCTECHSQLEKGKAIEGKEFAGGHEFNLAGKLVRSANITPDEESGLGKWSEQRFVDKFKGFANMTYDNAPRMNQSNFTVMPWLPMSQIPEEDLRAIYTYLRTLKPVHNPVEVHPPLAPPAQ